MPEKSKTYYATCRINAGLTQEEAANRLHISEKSYLSRFENGHIVPDQSLVAKMIQVYGTPSLAQWHVRYANPDLTPWLPEVTILHTDGDMFLQAEQTARIVCNQYKKIKKVLHKNKQITPNIGKSFRNSASRAMSIVAYIDDNLKIETVSPDERKTS